MFRIEMYVSPGGVTPFRVWLQALRDETARQRILVRVNRLERGLFGDCRGVGDGVRELRIDHGPGYRVYFAQSDRFVILLLGGGDKGTQESDIRTAIADWQAFRARRGT